MTKTKIINAEYVKGEVVIEKGEYSNGRTAILLKNINGETLAVASVNFPEIPIDKNTTYLKGWSENAGIPDELERLGIVAKTGRYVENGFVKAWEYIVLI